MDTITEPAVAPKKPTKPVKRRKKRAAAKAGKPAAAVTAKASDDLAGLTSTQCCFDCNPDRCVISGANFCGHPAKGSAQPAMQRDPEAMKRYNASRKKLEHQAADRRT